MIDFNRTSGVSEDAIHSLGVEIQDYNIRIRNVLQGITDAVNEAGLYLKGELEGEFLAKYEKLKSSYDIVYSNIDSYIDEFNTLLRAEKDLDIEVSLKLNAADSKIVFEGGIDKQWQK